MPQDRYQTVQELAVRLEVAEATVRQWIKAGSFGPSTSARAGASPTPICSVS